MIRINDPSDRVREHTHPKINRRIDNETRASLQVLASAKDDAIERHLETLDGEWDVERLLMTNASILALSGLALGTLVDRRWLILPGVVLPFLLQHAVQGWCPPLPVLRRAFGVRTRREIDREKFALKALRGDFDSNRLGSSEPAKRAVAALEAVTK
jgi:hypothetical protein